MAARIPAMTPHAILLAASLAALPAAAQVHWYAGIAGGQAKTHHELVQNRESTIINATNIQTAFDAKDAAWKAFAGLRFNPVLALEITYADLGSHRMTTTMQAGVPLVPASITIDRKISGYGVDLVATPPLEWRNLSLFGRIGSFRSRMEAAAQLDGFIEFTGGDPAERRRSTSRRETVLKWGLGAEWQAIRRAAVRLEWERYTAVGKAFAVGGAGTTGEADTDVVSLGVLVRF